MICVEQISETDIDSHSQQAEISKLAILSIVFGMLGPFSCGFVWVMSSNNFLIVNPVIIAIFSCGLTWMLGLISGVKSLRQIESSEGQLIGRPYAVIGIVASAVWMMLIFMVLFLPMIYCVNS